MLVSTVILAAALGAVSRAIILALPPRSRASLPHGLPAALLLLAAAGPLQAQLISNAPSRDPLMNLMLTQPKIDVDSPVVPEAGFDPPVVRPGEFATYRASFNALEASIDWPGKIPAPAGLEVRPTAQGQALPIFSTGTNIMFRPLTAFNFRVRAAQPGRYEIPEFKVTVYGKEVTVPRAQLAVLPNPPEMPPPLRIQLEVSPTNLYVGQAARVSMLFPLQPSGIPLLPLQQPPVQISGQGFILDQSSLRQRTELRPGPPGRGNLMALGYETTLTPIAAGKLSGFAQGFVGNRFSSGNFVLSNGAFVVPGGNPQYLLLESDPIELDVRPLPTEGRLPGFTGAVGVFSTDPAVLATNVLRVGDPVRLTVKVRGEPPANFSRLVAPPPPDARDWQVFPAPADNLPPQVIQAQGYATFSYILIPLTERARATPPIPFSCFDPALRAYVDLTVQPVPVLVEPGIAPADLAAVLQAREAAPAPEPEPVLSQLAAAPGASARSLTPWGLQSWYFLAQLLPAGGFLGLWLWDRRRRYLEEHPDLVRRRRARRALRRERRMLHAAARQGDASRFAAAAVSAIRVACAPHYPAEPRALVGGDVLPLLPPDARSGPPGHAVRRLFNLTDASRFAALPAEAGQLLALQPELEQVLNELEARLRAGN